MLTPTIISTGKYKNLTMVEKALTRCGKAKGILFTKDTKESIKNLILDKKMIGLEGCWEMDEESEVPGIGNFFFEGEGAPSQAEQAEILEGV